MDKYSKTIDIKLPRGWEDLTQKQLRSIVVNVLQGNMLDIQGLRDIVDLMRKNEEYFAEFANSDTAKLFTPPIFENKNKAHGYWF